MRNELLHHVHFLLLYMCITHKYDLTLTCPIKHAHTKHANTIQTQTKEATDHIAYHTRKQALALPCASSRTHANTERTPRRHEYILSMCNFQLYGYTR